MMHPAPTPPCLHSQQGAALPAELLLRLPAAAASASDDLVALLAAQQGLQLLPLYADGKAGQWQEQARSSASVAVSAASSASVSVAAAAAPAGPDWDSLLESSPQTRPSSAAGEGTPSSLPLTLLSAAGSGGPVPEGVAREAER